MKHLKFEDAINELELRVARLESHAGITEPLGGGQVAFDKSLGKLKGPNGSPLHVEGTYTPVLGAGSDDVYAPMPVESDRVS